MPKTIDCPRCNEGDTRHIGRNRCGNCECEFFVERGGKVTVAQFPLNRPVMSEMDIAKLCGGGRKRR